VAKFPQNGILTPTIYFYGIIVKFMGKRSGGFRYRKTAIKTVLSVLYVNRSVFLLPLPAIPPVMQFRYPGVG